jgi:hypothetical protein
VARVRPWSDEFAKVLGSVDLDAQTPLGGISLSPADPPRARLMAEERDGRENQRREAFADVQRFEEELLFALRRGRAGLPRVEDEWGRLVLAARPRLPRGLRPALRRRARSAETALQMAPDDQESQLLLALALIEGRRRRARRIRRTSPTSARCSIACCTPIR